MLAMKVRKNYADIPDGALRYMLATLSDKRAPFWLKLNAEAKRRANAPLLIGVK
jgi:hypothetical protein